MKTLPPCPPGQHAFGMLTQVCPRCGMTMKAATEQAEQVLREENRKQQAGETLGRAIGRQT